MDLLDYVTLMTVNPGFAGQKMVPDAPQKIRRVRQLLDAYEKENRHRCRWKHNNRKQQAHEGCRSQCIRRGNIEYYPQSGYL